MPFCDVLVCVQRGRNPLWRRHAASVSPLPELWRRNAAIVPCKKHMSASIAEKSPHNFHRLASHCRRGLLHALGITLLRGETCRSWGWGANLHFLPSAFFCLYGCKKETGRGFQVNAVTSLSVSVRNAAGGRSASSVSGPMASRCSATT